MKLSRTVIYAVQATLQLAQEQSKLPIPCSRLAAEGRMPERFLLQILRSLVTHGILQSTRGVDGGYSLERQPEEISLLDVIEAIDGPVVASLPLPEDESQPTNHVRLREAIEGVTINLRRQLDTIKITDLITTPALVNTTFAKLA